MYIIYLVLYVYYIPDTCVECSVCSSVTVACDVHKYYMYIIYLVLYVYYIPGTCTQVLLYVYYIPGIICKLYT